MTRIREVVVERFAEAAACLREILSHPARFLVIVGGELLTVGY